MSEKTIRIGYCLSLTGPLASNGKTARLAHDIWTEDVNRKGGLLGRKVEMVCLDDETNPKLVPDIYKRLLDVEKVDLLIGGYGDNSVAPAMPLVMERKRYLVAVMALAVNATLNYPNYFVMIPTGPHPPAALTEGFFELAARQAPKPQTLAILAADAAFSKAPIRGAKGHAEKHGFKVVSEELYPLSTTDFAPYIDRLAPTNPDILFYCSYLNDSAGLISAISRSTFEPKLVGGAMIGPQNGSIKTQLGPSLNGIVNYEYWLPVPALMYPGVADLIARYQSRADGFGADPLGYYVAPQAYAQMQVVEQAIIGANSLEDGKLAEFTHKAVFTTVVGDVKFGETGNWSEARVLEVQFQNIRTGDLSNFKEPNTQVVVWPPELASGSLIYPYANAKSSKGS
jgi:branched-chain amino acid transport system substrate-binding protein